MTSNAADQSGYQRIGPFALVPSTLAELGADSKEVLSSCGLAPNALDNPDGAIPFSKAGELLETCVRASNCPHFGLLLGQKATLSHFGLVGALMRNAPTLGDAIRDGVANHHRYVRGGVVYLFPLRDEVLLGYAVYQGAGMRGVAQICDVVVAGFCRQIRDHVGISPVEVLLSHSCPGEMAAYKRHYRAPIRFNAETSGLILSKSALAKSIAGADPSTRKLLQERVDSYWAAGAPSIVSRTQRALYPHILLGGATIANIAQSLSVNQRTLNRRLRDHNTSFRAELGRLRFELARQLLANTSIQITHISLAFGYSAASVFTRSFRRWSGKTPMEWREQKLS